MLHIRMIKKLSLNFFLIARLKFMPVLAIGLIAAGNQLTAANMSLYGGNEGLVNLTSGDNNVAVGDQSLADTTTGSQNTAIGEMSLKSNTTGAGNTALGRFSLYSNTTGGDNVAVGVGALTANIEGSQNTAIGSAAGSNNVIGTGNVFIGYMAGSQTSGSNMLVIDNSSTNTPLIYGDFAQESLTINGNLNVTGGLNLPSIAMDEIISTTGQRLLSYDQATGAVHIGQSSMVFYDSSGAVGNGTDIMTSSVGKIQIGQNSTDVTSFVGEVNVPTPTKPEHAATKRYTDNTAAMTMAMASAINPTGEGNHFGFKPRNHRRKSIIFKPATRSSSD